jgi:hypothetical protein
LSVSNEEYIAYRQRLESNRHDTPIIDAVVVENESRLSPKVFEAGNVWQSTNDIAFDNTIIAGSLFVVFDTLLGPIYIAYGAAQGGRRSAYLFLGQTFQRRSFFSCQRGLN